MADRDGLIVDYGGVLTSDPFASFEAFCAAERLAPDTVREHLRNDPDARDLLARLETGALTAAEFELAFGALLGVAHPQLLQRMFGGMEPDTTMIDGVRELRRTGVGVVLLSNSIGGAYDRDLLEELFDAWVISSSSRRGRSAWPPCCTAATPRPRLPSSTRF